MTEEEGVARVKITNVQHPHNKNSGRAALLCRCFCLKVDNKKGFGWRNLRSGGSSH